MVVSSDNMLPFPNPAVPFSAVKTFDKNEKWISTRRIYGPFDAGWMFRSQGRTSWSRIYVPGNPPM